MRLRREEAFSFCLPHHEIPQELPLGIALRSPVLATAVIEVAPGRFVERMNQQHALRIASYRHFLYGREVLPGLFFGPRGAALGERLQGKHRAALAGVAG